MIIWGTICLLSYLLSVHYDYNNTVKIDTEYGEKRFKALA